MTRQRMVPAGTACVVLEARVPCMATGRIQHRLLRDRLAAA